MRLTQHLLPAVATGADFLQFKDTFGARRVESALSKACLVPDVSNRRGQAGTRRKKISPLGGGTGSGAWSE